MKFELPSAETNSGGSRRGSGGSKQIISYLKEYSRKMRDHLQIDPLPYLSEPPFPPLNKKANINISDFTEKPVR